MWIWLCHLYQTHDQWLETNDRPNETTLNYTFNCYWLQQHTFKYLTSSTWNESIYKSSMRNNAIASSTENPITSALMKSAAFWRAPTSSVCCDVWRKKKSFQIFLNIHWNLLLIQHNLFLYYNEFEDWEIVQLVHKFATNLNKKQKRKI